MGFIGFAGVIGFRVEGESLEDLENMCFYGSELC